MEEESVPAEGTAWYKYPETKKEWQGQLEASVSGTWSLRVWTCGEKTPKDRLCSSNNLVVGSRDFLMGSENIKEGKQKNVKRI